LEHDSVDQILFRRYSSQEFLFIEFCREMKGASFEKELKLERDIDEIRRPPFFMGHPLGNNTTRLHPHQY
jgi:hypothetical protein